MSNILEFNSHTNEFGLLDGTIQLSTPMALPITHGSIRMQVCSITISDRIPNFFDARSNGYNFFNTKLTFIGTVLGVDHSQAIIIPNGLYYTVSDVQNAVNYALTHRAGDPDSVPTSWWTGEDDPGFTITANTVTDQIVIYLDNSKLNPAIGYTSFTVDMTSATNGGSLFAKTLGFSEATALFVRTGASDTYTSDIEARMDTQGTVCDVQTSLVVARRRNNAFVKTIAIVPFSGKTDISDNVWPNGGQISPIMIYEGSRVIKYFDFQVKTLEGNPMFFLSGGLHVIVSFL